MSWRQCSEVQTPLGTDPNLTVTHDFEECHIYEKLLLPRGSSLLSLQIGNVENFLFFFPQQVWTKYCIDYPNRNILFV